MKYINIQNGTWIIFDEVKKTSRVVSKSEIERQISELETDIADKEITTDEQLLAWARENRPNSQDEKNLILKRGKLVELQELFNNLS